MVRGLAVAVSVVFASWTLLRLIILPSRREWVLLLLRRVLLLRRRVLLLLLRRVLLLLRRVLLLLRRVRLLRRELLLRRILLLRRELLLHRVVLLRRVGAASLNDDEIRLLFVSDDAIRVGPRSNRLGQSHAQALVAAKWAGSSQPVRRAVVRGEVRSSPDAVADANDEEDYG
jgi:hypothetical protein